ncbi:hypothetical protein M9H77_08004 [Catharanthus roseus]|uniref:Uncharacterized protein n=1 Tax=Catharanthus roseus TaxID=4058 RepID=A0ACC0BWT6_CATRO|nr:hypothetical protein M9H77_08004 [Catharanthus roseus]
MELKFGPMTRARMKKLKAYNRNEDNGMTAYMEEALKNKFERQGKASKCFSICSISKDHQGNNLIVKIAKYGRKGTLPPMIAPPLPSLIGFCCALMGYLIPTTYGSFLLRSAIGSSNCVIGVLTPLFPQVYEAWILIGLFIGELGLKILNRGSSRKGGDPWKGLESKLQSKWIYIKVL